MGIRKDLKKKKPTKEKPINNNTSQPTFRPPIVLIKSKGHLEQMPCLIHSVELRLARTFGSETAMFKEGTPAMDVEFRRLSVATRTLPRAPLTI